MLKDWILNSPITYIHIDIFEPWYEKWPIFIEKSVYAFEKEGYKYLSVSDISSYFENINLDILRDLLLKYFSADQKIINLLINILEHWTWPTRHLTIVRRGIPQANSISSFLGNIYLIPLDEAFDEFSKTFKIKYFRYMDDVKIFTKRKDTAIKSLFLMNETLRDLQLNVQGQKTQILSGENIRKELVNERFSKINSLVSEFQKGRLKKRRKDEILKALEEQLSDFDTGEMLKGIDLRIYLRLLTGFMLAMNNSAVNSVLNQIEINPDSRLTKKALNYLKLFPEESKISKRILKFLKSRSNLFAYQEANLLKLLKYSHRNVLKIQNYAEKTFRNKSKHWYVRSQAVNILSNRIITPRSFNKVVNTFKNEKMPEVKRALIKLLSQLDYHTQKEALELALYDPYYKISNLGKMLLFLRNDRESALQEIKYIFTDCYENKLIDNFYKIGVIRYNDDKEVIKRLRYQLIKNSPKMNNKYLKLKIKSINENLKSKQIKPFNPSL